jgi:hypothetical protein
VTATEALHALALRVLIRHKPGNAPGHEFLSWPALSEANRRAWTALFQEMSANGWRAPKQPTADVIVSGSCAKNHALGRALRSIGLQVWMQQTARNTVWNRFDDAFVDLTDWSLQSWQDLAETLVANGWLTRGGR